MVGAFKASARKFPSECPTHCECNVLQYFATHEIKPRSVGYIGVSKPSCAVCNAVFQVWNKLRPQSKYQYRGSHGKFYFPWAMPRHFNPKDESELVNATYTEIAGILSDVWVGEGLAGSRLRDSSALSGTDSIMESSASDEELGKEFLSLKAEGWF